MINFEFKPEDNIIFINYSDSISLNDYTLLINDLGTLRETYNLPKTLLILSDYSNAKIEIEYQDIPALFVMMQQYFDEFDRIAEAFIQVNPFETALSVIAKEHSSAQSTYVSEVFSTREAAMSWLKKH